MFLKGVSYGPFAPREDGEPLPPDAIIRTDLEAMRRAGVNTLRLHVPPPRSFLDLCAEFGMRVLITLPWEQHIDFLRRRSVRSGIRRSLRDAVRERAGHCAILGYLVGNEIPPQMVRWLGPVRVQHFLEDLVRICRREDPEALYSYATYPPTEYLFPDRVDFVCVNVYLHDTDRLERYLRRMQNLVGDLPLVLGEFGMDTQRHSENEQAALIESQVHTAIRTGTAGAVVFAWTDEWFRGGRLIDDWAFGVVDAERRPKQALAALTQAWGDTEPATRLREPLPAVSVIVCAYNAAATLGECLQSLTELRYSSYEVIVVDDGSDDETAAVAGRFAGVQCLQLAHQGLSAARNAGAAAASGEILAYLDADCMADPDWLAALVERFQAGDFAAVGGPNIPPPAQSWLQAAVAAAPGGPTHVLFNDTEAEHIPGCNMAVTRDAFQTIGGFDPQFLTAGDDVDFCWRLQQHGLRIGFSPGAVVWHYRRFTPKAYFRQQAGYGEAEAMLRMKHLAAYSRTGNARWRGRVYPAGRGLLRFHRAMIYFGTFGNAPWQSLYPRGRSDLAAVSGGLEWLAVLGLLLVAGFFVPGLFLLAGAMGLVTFFHTLRTARTLRLERRLEGATARGTVFLLSLLQPWIRGANRHLAWVKGKRTPGRVIGGLAADSDRPTRSRRRLQFWSDTGIDRESLLNCVQSLLHAEEWRYSMDTGWTNWDLQIYGSFWWKLDLLTVTEYHGGPECLTRARLSLRPRSMTKLAIGLLVAVGVAAGWSTTWWWGLLALPPLLWLLWRGRRLRHAVAEVVFDAAEQSGLTPLTGSDKPAVR